VKRNDIKLIFFNHHNIKGSFVRIRVCNGKQWNGAESENIVNKKYTE